jgi:hypothetical protein
MQNITRSSGSLSFKASSRFAVAAVSVAAALACGGVSAQGKATTPTTEAYAPGRILVMPRAGLPDSALARILNENGGGKARRIGKSELRIVDLPRGREKAMVERLARHPHFKFAELDRLVAGTGVANDPYFGSAWHLGRINAPTAWDSSMGSGVTIAILDTGIDSAHPDLAARMVAGWNFVDNNSNTSDVNGHGTGVAGAAAAATNNGAGVAAVAGQAKLMPVRIADANAYAYWSTIAQGVTYAADNGARVINISYDQLPLSSAVINAAQYAKNKGALVVVAAGNRSQNENFTPTTSMIPVSATDGSDLITSWSSWGSYVALSAPGLNIWSTTRGGGYAQWWGTSVASPVTAGVVALMMATKPSLSSSQIESALFKSATDLGAAGRDSYYGFGRVDAAAAVQAALSTTTVAADTQVPTVSVSAPLASSTVSGLTTVNVSAADNVGVGRVELRVNGSLLATDAISPFGFSWDTTRVANGMASVVARACDAAGNCADSANVAVNVANSVDTTLPTVRFVSPGNGVTVSGTVNVASSATDNAGVAGLTNVLYLNGIRVASSSGSGALSYNWNTRKAKIGSHTLRVDTTDAAGNKASTSIVVNR